MPLNKFEKIKLNLRSWLQGRAEADPEYFVALEAFDFVERLTAGEFRKNGKDPEFSHMLQVAQLARTYARYLLRPAQTIAAAILHDIMEDKGVAMKKMVELFGQEIADVVWRLTKKFRGVVKPMEVYFREIAKCPIASVIKGLDRITNVRTMLDVFKLSKQKSYAQEVVDLFLPMLKAARRRFPQQEALYENIKMILESMLELYGAIHSGRPQPA